MKENPKHNILAITTIETVYKQLDDLTVKRDRFKIEIAKLMEAQQREWKADRALTIKRLTNTIDMFHGLIDDALKQTKCELRRSAK